jgi:hypothetical protein
VKIRRAACRWLAAFGGPADTTEEPVRRVSMRGC